MNIRAITNNDQKIFLRLIDEFYHSDAVLHPVDKNNYDRTFYELTSDSPYAKAWIFESDGETAGYGMISLTYSNEVGGIVVWIEELYILPQFRGQGIGKAFFKFLHKKYDSKVKRYRLEVEPDNLRAKRLYEKLGFTPLPYSQMILDIQNPAD